MAAAVQMVSLAMARAGLRCGIAICGASACLLALMAPALATDLIPTSETRWDDFYWGPSLVAHGATAIGAMTTTLVQYDRPCVGGDEFRHRCERNHRRRQAGFNYQTGPWVIGVEG